MTRKNIFIILVITLFCCLNVNTVYAKEYNIDGIKIEMNDESVLLPESEDSSSYEKHSNARGSIISYALGSIDNDGNGNMTFMIETNAHVSCDEIRHKAYIEVWNEANESWETLDSLLFVEKKEDHPGELFVSLTSLFTIEKMEVGRYYRLSGSHLVKLNGKVESLSTCTDGVLNHLH